MTEIQAIAAVSAALDKITDQAAQHRVLRWACEKYGLQQSQTRVVVPPAEKFKQELPINGDEWPGVAKVTSDGKLLIVIRDLKAGSANDAAVRLAHLVLLAAERLLKSTEISSTAMLVPILKHWRAYDGNTRGAIARSRGIVRNGDKLSLDHHSRQDAERYVAEVLNAELKGAWQPGGRAVTAKKKTPTKTKNK